VSAYAEAYEDYMRYGWHPIPTRTDGPGAGKAPAVAWTEYQDTAPSPEQVRVWAQLYRGANIGTTTGATPGLLVLDFDKAKREDERDGRDYFNEIKGRLPHTPMAITGGGGYHVFLAYPHGWRVPNDARIEVDGQRVAMDVRAEGGFIVLPPSVHPETGERYRWQEGCDPDTVAPKEAPEWVLDLVGAVRDGERRTARTRDAQIGEGAVIPEGERNDALTRKAGQLRRAGMDYADILASLEGINQRFCDPPLDAREVASIAGSSLHWEKGNAGDYDLDDSGNADYVIEKHGKFIKYDPESGEWWAYNGKYWVSVEETVIRGRCEDALLERKAEILATLPDNEDDKKARVQFARQLGNDKRRVSCVRTLAGRQALRPPRRDEDLIKLCTPSGIVDLRTGELYEHTPEEWHIRCTTAPYDPDAECSEFLEFLEGLFSEDDKRDLIEYTQQAIGYTLAGGGSEHVLHVMLGPTRGGKGTFLNVVQNILGDYGVSIPPRAILTQRWASNGPTPHLARLPGARMARLSETSRGQQMDTALVKQLTGGDPISARGAYAKNVKQFTPRCGWWMDTNELPHISARDGAIWARLRVIECPFSHEGREDRALYDRLIGEASGVLTWCVNGAIKYLQNGALVPPECVTRTSKRERDDQDTIKAWLLEDYGEGEGEHERVARDINCAYGALYEQYREWCNKSGYHAMGRNNWGKQMEAYYGFTKYRRTDSDNALWITNDDNKIGSIRQRRSEDQQSTL
jgi:putative DNA primase/helicase